MARKLCLLLAVVLVPTLVVAACSGGGSQPAAAQASTQGDASAGKAVFDQNCAGCHPGGGQGAGPALKGRGLSADRIKTQVRQGGGSMPAYPDGKISDQQLNNLVAYVQSLK